MGYICSQQAGMRDYITTERTYRQKVTQNQSKVRYEMTDMQHAANQSHCLHHH